MTTPAPHPHRWAGLAVLSASLLLVVMDMTILNVALPALSNDLRPDSIQLLWMVDIYSLVVSGLLVTVSNLGDRWGRRRMLVTGFAIFGAASLGVLMADSPGDVIAVRAFLGVGGAMIMPSTLSMIRQLFTDPRERATALGIWSTMAGIGAAFGPILGGTLLQHFSWHSAFLVNVPVMVVAIAAALWLLPESRNPKPGRWDAVGTVLSIVGMAALIYSIKHFGKDGFTDTGALVAFAVAAAALTWFVVRCLRRPDPILEVRLFRRPAFSAGVLAAITTSIALASTMLLMTQWMQLVQGYSPLETGLRVLPEAIGAAVVSPFAPALASRIGARTVLAGGVAVSGIGCLVVLFGPQPLSYLPVAIAMTLIGAGMGSLAIASAVIMAGAPPEKSGSAAAIEETSYELGGTLGVAVLGSVAAAVYRSGLSTDELAARGVTGAAADTARESLAGALEVMRDGRLALDAFNDSFAGAFATGGVLLLAAAAAIWALTPKDMSHAENPEIADRTKSSDYSAKL
ncbi:MFS transporter [Spirillospora sp. CA-294931]|uniref:MFS transporter n=1 Tax=Spirillospora sp. CA-294931 TaxID=3240042 RepID=UPI003D92DB74